MVSTPQDRKEKETKRKRVLRDNYKQVIEEHEALEFRIIEPELNLVLSALTNSGTRYGELLEFLREIASEARVPRIGYEILYWALGVRASAKRSRLDDGLDEFLRKKTLRTDDIIIKVALTGDELREAL